MTEVVRSSCNDSLIAGCPRRLELESALQAAEAKIAELQEALKPFIQHYEAWMDKYGDEVLSSTYSRHTFGDLRRARAALSNRGQDQNDG